VIAEFPLGGYVAPSGKLRGGSIPDGQRPRLYFGCLHMVGKDTFNSLRKKSPKKDDPFRGICEAGRGSDAASD